MEYTAEIAGNYALCRSVCVEVVASLVEEGGILPGSHVLEVGCGSCNYLRAVSQTTGCSVAGLDPSEDMLSEARRLGGVRALKQGRAEDLADLWPPGSFDVVFSVDVIHHVNDIAAYLTGACEVLNAGGRICTVTDSEGVIRGRRPLSEFWPETVAHELRRYPSVDDVLSSLGKCGFTDLLCLSVSREYRLTSAEPYERKAFSALHLISPEEFERGLVRLRAALARGHVIANTAYVLIWGTKPTE
jgi:cyclopropane fatty-acyl-phospholipid synthase-like methyltransferase